MRLTVQVCVAMWCECMHLRSSLLYIFIIALAFWDVCKWWRWNYNFLPKELKNTCVAPVHTALHNRKICTLHNGHYEYYSSTYVSVPRSWSPSLFLSFARTLHLFDFIFVLYRSTLVYYDCSRWLRPFVTLIIKNLYEIRCTHKTRDKSIFYSLKVIIYCPYTISFRHFLNGSYRKAISETV